MRVLTSGLYSFSHVYQKHVFFRIIDYKKGSKSLSCVLVYEQLEYLWKDKSFRRCHTETYGFENDEKYALEDFSQLRNYNTDT